MQDIRKKNTTPNTSTEAGQAGSEVDLAFLEAEQTDIQQISRPRPVIALFN